MTVRRQGRPAPRAGLSLLEVIISVAIFVVAIVALESLMSSASNRAQETRWQTVATRHCQSKLAEVIAGALPISEPQTEATIDDDPEFTWTMETESDSIPNLYRVKVTVSRARSDGSRLEVSLQQYVLDPTARGSLADTPAPSSSGLAAGVQTATAAANASAAAGAATGATTGSGTTTGSGAAAGSGGITGPTGGIKR